MARVLPDLKTNGVYILIRPSAFVQSQVDEYAARRFARIRIGGRLTAFYFVNLLLYAGPLTLAGFGVVANVGRPPPVFTSIVVPIYSDALGIWQFMWTLLQNSAYLLVASIVTFITFHVGVLLTRSSRGVAQSLHTIVHSTGIYLAVIFTLTWYLSTADSIVVADEFLIMIQKEFVYYFIDLTGSNVGLVGGRPEPIELTNLTLQARIALTGLVLSLLYFLYSLYLGARINHKATRFDSGVTLLFVALSPAIYVLGSLGAFFVSNAVGFSL